MTDEPTADLEKRVVQFQCLELPGQPKMVHVGTMTLVMDLWRVLRAAQERAKSGEARMAALEEALTTAALAFEQIAAVDDERKNGVRPSVRAAEARAELERAP